METNNQGLKIKNKSLPILLLVFALLLIFSVGAFASQYVLSRIDKCATTGNNICYSVIKNSAGLYRYQIQNLDKDKKYQMTIRKKIGDKTVDIGTVDVDMNKIKGQAANKVCLAHQQSADTQNITCCSGLVMKTDLSVSSSKSLFACCNADECSKDGICIKNGVVISESGKRCVSGDWQGYTAPKTSCTDTDAGMDIYKKGHVSWPTQSFEFDDYCLDSGSLMEGVCSTEEEAA
jgi:hypothetical protein